MYYSSEFQMVLKRRARGLLQPSSTWSCREKKNLTEIITKVKNLT